MSRKLRTLHLVLDFDGTLTTHDTLTALSRIGYAAFPDVSPSWNEISEAYMSDYKAHESNYQPPASQRRTIEQETAWLRSLKPIEEASADRIERSGFLRKLNAAQISDGAGTAINNRQVEFRPGWGELLRRMQAHAERTKASRTDATNKQSACVVGTNILSVNFSQYFVYSCLWKMSQQNLQSESSEDVRSVQEAAAEVGIYANEMAGITDVIANDIKGEAAQVRTSGDKLQLFRKINQSFESEPLSLTVYVGDSSTDLECLLAADVGICIQDKKMRSGQTELAETCTRLQIPVNHIHEHETKYVLASSVEPQAACRVRLWWARDFREVDRFISELLAEQSANTAR